MRLRLARKAYVLAALLLAACGDVKSPTEPLGAPDGQAFTFAQVQAQVFTPTCAKAGCHSASAGSGGLVLEAGRSYGEIVNRPAVGNASLDRIEPGDPGRSYLIKKLRGDPDITGARMPLDNPGSLTQEQMDGLVGWVLAGAPNN
ncbi:MAG: hypothetical protein QOH06_1455 [Acidobacteriota bacterium]|jgi:hypothetical protein|nr:hypothetical protein [Acidobacteriota bacterium]